MKNLVEVPQKYEDQVEKFRELYLDACKIRMRSDVPIGTALSGGLDSSATICTMAHIAKNHLKDRVATDWQHAFVATFPNTFLDESYYAQKVVEHIKIPASFIEIDPARGIETIENYLYLFEEIYLTSPIPMMDLYGAIKAGGVTVTLDGHGADELFSGYGDDIFKAFFDAGLNFNEISNILKTYRGLVDIESPQVPKVEINLGTYFQYMTQKSRGILGLTKYYLKSILSKSENISNEKLGVFNSYLYNIFHQTILPTLLRNYDRYSMANGVEIRMPFLDYRLVSYCFSLPWNSKLRNGYTKTIVRDALEDIMPQEVVWRTSKIGFNTPIVDWMRNQWKEFLLDIINSSDFENCSLIDKNEARKKIQKVVDDEKATFSDGEKAWMAIMPYFWEKSVVKTKYF